ncbi:hypothetical protein [Nonomuraea sp. 10N515B]|uniref:hypothetical protein n=1 Tax=Nonomuraea sp. 10N515B TaxID=3457422 RepID=UPI003FCCFBDD
MNKVATFDLGYTRDMLRALFDLPIPESGEVHYASPDFSEADPAACRADGAVLFRNGEEKFGVILETQRARDKDKIYAWLEYIANFRAREKCPVCLIVICPRRRVARWALRAIETGHPELRLIPLVIYSDNTPVITDVAQALENIGLAIMSAVTKSEDPQINAIIAAVEQALYRIDPGKAWRYARYISMSLYGTAQKEWERRMSTMTYPYQGEYAESLLAEGEARGKARGEAQGEAKAVLYVLEDRGLVVSDQVRERVMACQDEAILRAWLRRAIVVESAKALFD